MSEPTGPPTVPHRRRRRHLLGQDHRQRTAGRAHRRASTSRSSSSTRTTSRATTSRSSSAQLANYDHPDAFDWQLLNDHIAALAAGATVPVPIYDYADLHAAATRCAWCSPSRIVVVEGILVLYEPTLRERFDLKVYVDTDADLRLIRRLQRDVAERGRTPESIVTQYLATVRPSHEQFIEPSKRHADVIFPQGGLNEPALDVLLARVRELVRV